MMRSAGRLALALALASCGRSPDAEPAARCPPTLPAPDPLPRVRREHLRLETWLALWPPEELDGTILSPQAIAAHNRALAACGRGGRGFDALLEIPERDRLAALVRARLHDIEEQVRRGELRAEKGRVLLTRDVRAPPALPTIHPEVRVALGPVAIRCSPYPGPLFRGDGRFDRNLCSTLRPQEPVQLLMRWPHETVLARTPYVLGWIEADAALSPALDPQDAHAFLVAPRVVVEPGRQPLPLDGSAIVRATREGLVREPRPEGARSTQRPLTRRAFLEAAYARLGERYGWAGENGGYDCSQLAQEVFAEFGLHLPRNSAQQMNAGTSTIVLQPHQSAHARERALDAAHARGIVLLAFPGHVMLYLGRSREGTPMVLHALAEYAEPCPGGGETVRRVDRVVVSDLALGEGSSRGSLLERLTHIALFAGPSPDP